MGLRTHGIRRIGVLTGGGDCPGLNAVIRAVVKTAIVELGLEVWGIESGFWGLIRNRMRRLGLDDVANILTTGGTILGACNKADPSRFCVGRDGQGRPVFRDVTDRVIEHMREARLDLLVCIGGDGTMTGAMELIRRGVHCVGVPKTIDNDLAGTDLTFGFQTAVQTATEAIDRVHTTAASHHRVMVVEVMGRNAGWVAVHAGMAGGADVILIPEIPFDLDCVSEFCMERALRGKRSTIIAASEGARLADGRQVVESVVDDSPDPVRLGGIARVLADGIMKRTDLETRSTILGHVQRGGTPCAADRVLATQFGYAAAMLIADGHLDRMVVLRDGRIGSVAIAEVAGRQRLVDPDDALIRAARAVDTCFGDRPAAAPSQVRYCVVGEAPAASEPTSRD